MELAEDSPIIKAQEAIDKLFTYSAFPGLKNYIPEPLTIDTINQKTIDQIITCLTELKGYTEGAESRLFLLRRLQSHLDTLIQHDPTNDNIENLKAASSALKYLISGMELVTS